MSDARANARRKRALDLPIYVFSVKPNKVKELTILDQTLNNIEIQWQPPVTDRKLKYLVSWRSQWQAADQWQVESDFYSFQFFTDRALLI